MKSAIFLLFAFCLIYTRAASQSWDWVAGINNGDYVSTTSISTDALGDIYITGGFKNTLSLDTIDIQSNGDRDIFIAKYNGQGHVLWAKSIGGTGVDYASAVIADNNGNIYVAATFSGTVSFNQTTSIVSAGGTDVFLAKFNSSGDFTWVKPGGGSSNDISVASGIAINSQGKIFYCGSINSSMASFGNVSILANGHDAFWAEYSANGDLVRAKSAGNGSGSGAFGYGIGIDSFDNIYLSGNFDNSTHYVDNIQLQSISQGFTVGNAFVAKYDSAGNAQWAKPIGGINTSGGSNGAEVLTYNMEVDKYGNSYITGTFVDCLLALPTYVLSGTGDIYLVKFDTNGNLKWAKSIGNGANIEHPASIYIDGNLNVYTTGEFSGQVITGADTLHGAGGGDVYIIKLDSSGNELWAKSCGGSANDAGSGITADASGNLYVTGYYNSNTINFGNYSMGNDGDYDAFLAKLSLITGIPNITSEKGIGLYPNPCEDKLTVSFSANTFTKITVIDVTGKSVYSNEIKQGIEHLNIDLSQLMNGTYFVRLEGHDIMTSRGIFIKK